MSVATTPRTQPESTNNNNPNPDKPDVWYLAYGSNMSRAKFTGSRGIVPKATARVRVPGWVLAFNIPGLPYSEPAFTSIVPRAGARAVAGYGTEIETETDKAADADAVGAAPVFLDSEKEDASLSK